MPNETMNDPETQTADPTTEAPVQQDTDSSATEGSSASELESAIENESQPQSQEEPAAVTEEALGDDTQPVAAPATPGVTPEAARFAAVEKENSDLKAMVRETMEVIKQRELAAMKPAAQPTAPKGQWKEKLSKHFQGPDAAVLSEALEAALSERLGDVDNIKQDVSFMKPWLEQFGVEHEMNRGANVLVSEGVPQSVVAKLRPEVDAMLKSGIRAPAEFMYRAAYAKHAMKEKSALATKTLQARTQTKPQAPAPKQNPANSGTTKFTLTPPKPGADPVEEMASFLKQVKKY
jgi:hypothetical protein